MGKVSSNDPYPSFSQQKLQGFVQLLRVKYHWNYGIVVLPVILYEGQGGSPWVILAVHYCLLSTLMGGIYTINALSDLQDDLVHPIKRFRPIPSGLISPQEAMGMVIACFAAAFAGAYWYAPDQYQHFWPIYAALIVVNLVYSFVVRPACQTNKAVGRWRWCISITSMLRVWYGITIFQVQHKARSHYFFFVLFFLGMGTVQNLKFRLEGGGGGCAINPVAAQDSCLELLFVIALGLMVAFYLFDPKFTIELLLVSVGLLHWSVVCPWLAPSTFPCPFYDIPQGAVTADSVTANKKTKQTGRFWRTAWALLRYGSFQDFIGFSAMSIFVFGPTFVLMGLEDLFLPELSSSLDSSRVAFLLGHPRSGITNLHRTLRQHPQVSCAPMLRAASPSLVLRPVIDHFLKPFVAMILSRFDSSQRRVAVDEVLAEHFWLLPLLRTEVLVQLFPSMIDSPDFDELFAEQVDYNENDLIFLRRCLARQLWADGLVVGSNGGANNKQLYVARPVGLTHRWQLLRKAFPQSKLLVMVRRPAESFACEARLNAVTIGAAHRCDGDVGSSLRLNKLMASVYKSYSEPTFQTILRLAQNPPENVHMIDYCDWTSQPSTVLRSTLTVLGLDATVAASLAIVPKNGEDSSSSQMDDDDKNNNVSVASGLVAEYEESYFGAATTATKPQPQPVHGKNSLCRSRSSSSSRGH